MNVLFIFLNGLWIFLMFAVPRFSQWNNYSINPENFKKVKIKKLKFLFTGLGTKDSIYHDVKEYGIIYPMFVYQILGYVCAVLAVIITLIASLVFHLKLSTITIINASILLFDIILGTILICICSKNKPS